MITLVEQCSSLARQNSSRVSSLGNLPAHLSIVKELIHEAKNAYHLQEMLQSAKYIDEGMAAKAWERIIRESWPLQVRRRPELLTSSLPYMDIYRICEHYDQLDKDEAARKLSSGYNSIAKAEIPIVKVSSVRLKNRITNVSSSGNGGGGGGFMSRQGGASKVTQGPLPKSSGLKSLRQLRRDIQHDSNAKNANSGAHRPTSRANIFMSKRPAPCPERSDPFRRERLAASSASAAGSSGFPASNGAFGPLMRPLDHISTGKRKLDDKSAAPDGLHPVKKPVVASVNTRLPSALRPRPRKPDSSLRPIQRPRNSPQAPSSLSPSLSPTSSSFSASIKRSPPTSQDKHMSVPSAVTPPAAKPKAHPATRPKIGRLGSMMLAKSKTNMTSKVRYEPRPTPVTAVGTAEVVEAGSSKESQA
ncbi:uncharacterized protein BROUX77_006874 [Berkeleyomyces rouxiae]|uniref:uncharacterized protein n=1 Tax=Berkeleyomyces rouxiae TaxID=2035830 RepID=UPI003B795F98